MANIINFLTMKVPKKLSFWSDDMKNYEHVLVMSTYQAQ